MRVAGTVLYPKGLDVLENHDFLKDLNVPLVLLDPLTSPNKVIAFLDREPPMFCLGTIEHGSEPIISEGANYCPRCGLMGKIDNGEAKINGIPVRMHEDRFVCLNFLCNFRHSPKVYGEASDVSRDGSPTDTVAEEMPRNVGGGSLPENWAETTGMLGEFGRYWNERNERIRVARQTETEG